MITGVEFYDMKKDHPTGSGVHAKFDGFHHNDQTCKQFGINYDCNKIW